MEYTAIENKFADYIIDLLGPNKDLDKQREDKFNFIKNLISGVLEKDYPDYKTHIICFGSFPLRTYLHESDLDITILFEEKANGELLVNYSFDFLNKYLDNLNK